MRTLSLILCAGIVVAAEQPRVALRQQVDSWVRANQKPIVTELVQLLSIPNVAADRDNIRKNATLLREMLARRGFTAELLETAGNPLVWGELKTPGATRTLLFYAHYDGQPVNPKDWRQPSPFTPILRDGRMEDGATDLGESAGARRRSSRTSASTRAPRPTTSRRSSRSSRRSTR